VRLNRYDFIFSCAPGKTRMLVDALSRAYFPCDQTNASGTRLIQVNTLHNVSDECLDIMRRAMPDSTETKKLLRGIKHG